MDYENLTAPCGINCAQCEIYNGYGGKDPRKAKPLFLALIPLFSFLGLFSKTSRTRLRVLKRILRIPKDKPLCRGCRNHDGITPLMAKGTSCLIYECTKAKGLHNCSMCSDFPCENIYPKAFMAGIIPHNLKLANCCMIKKHGLEKWANDYSHDLKENYFKGDLPIEL